MTFFKCIEKYTKQVFTPKWEEIKESELKQVKGLLQVDNKKEKIDESLKPIFTHFVSWPYLQHASNYYRSIL
jgi:hypothetical protein